MCIIRKEDSCQTNNSPTNHNLHLLLIAVLFQPFLVILTSSWRKAEDVFMETMKITGNRRDLRITLLHAGGQEENKAVS